MSQLKKFYKRSPMPDYFLGKNMPYGKIEYFFVVKEIRVLTDRIGLRFSI